MLEHLTWDEANRTLADWHRALAVGGTVHIVVPDLRVHIDQWNRAEWTEASLLSKKTDARWGFAGFYGWQRHCDPLAPDYDPSYWDVHKSGYDARLMEFLLARHGYGGIEIVTEADVHLIARARRVFAEGERQVAPTLDGIRADHVARYRFAAGRIEPRWRCLDAACGIGYGARILADAVEGAAVLGVDREAHAIEYGRRHYAGGGVLLETGDVLAAPWAPGSFDAAVTFETIEHLDDPERFLAGLAAALRPGGLLVASTPNETLLPFDRERVPHHVRHWCRGDLDALLASAGFRVEERWCQRDKAHPEVVRGDEGTTLLAVARRG
jgi:SAM-dependent methyltransferase